MKNSGEEEASSRQRTEWEPFCTKIAYVSRELAEFARQRREQYVGKRMWPYRCRRKCCKRYKYYHLSSRIPLSVRKGMDRVYKIVDTWENEGGALNPRDLED